MQVQQMISAHPTLHGTTGGALVQCIEECLECAQACTACADACISEPNVAVLRQCIRLNLDSADLCFTTARIASRHAGGNTGALGSLLQACSSACGLCAAECSRHEHMDHCRLCAECCERCARACEGSLRALPIQ